MAVGSASAGDLNRGIRLDNLALASAIEPFGGYSEVAGELRCAASGRLAVAARFGYLWREHQSGRMSRRVSALPATLGLTYQVLDRGRWRLGPSVGAGLLLDASLGGDDPLGGVSRSGTGKILEGGFEAEYFLTRSFSLRARGLARWAVARDVLPDGGDLDLSGVLGEGALRIYLGQ